MQNLIYFLQRYYHFFLFLLLEGIAFYFVISYNTYQKAVFFNTSNQISGTVYNTRDNITHYFSLSKTNEELLEDNARLRNLLKESYKVDTVAEIAVNDTFLKQQYSYISARVIRNSVNSPSNFITLDKGSKEGVKKLMGVINKDGVVGIIYDVSTNYSVAISVLNINNSEVSAQIEETGDFGKLVWDAKSPLYARLTNINKHVPVRRGQKIVSSTFSGVFPEGVPIGTIVDAEVSEGTYDIKVKLAPNFGNLSGVYIVNNLYKEELDSLHSKITAP